MLPKKVKKKSGLPFLFSLPQKLKKKLCFLQDRFFVFERLPFLSIFFYICFFSTIKLHCFFNKKQTDNKKKVKEPFRRKKRHFVFCLRGQRGSFHFSKCKLTLSRGTKKGEKKKEKQMFKISTFFIFLTLPISKYDLRKNKDY